MGGISIHHGGQHSHHAISLQPNCMMLAEQAQCPRHTSACVGPISIMGWMHGGSGSSQQLSKSASDLAEDLYKVHA